MAGVESFNKTRDVSYVAREDSVSLHLVELFSGYVVAFT